MDSDSTPVDQGMVWCLPPLDHLRFMRAMFVQHAFTPHSHDYFVLGMIEQGVQSFKHERQKFVTIPGKLIIINPGEVHTGESVLQEGFAYRALYPTVALMKALAREFRPDTDHLPEFRGGVIDDAHLFAWIQRLHRLSEQAISSLELETRFTAFFVELIRRHAVQPLTLRDHPPRDRDMLRVRDYLEAHYAENVTLAELSQTFHISPFHLARLFQRQMGIPPHKYLENVRIRHAERLLSMPIALADIAYATGFSSQSHFNRTFKRFIGTTPGKFAQQRKIV